jgi:hypothetical protein
MSTTNGILENGPIRKLLSGIVGTAPGGTTGLAGSIIEHGSFSSSTAGWVSVSFSTTFTKTPTVLATQGIRGAVATNQKLTAPTLTPRTITPPSLSALQVPPVPTVTSWGSRLASYMNGACSSTLGQIPYIGGYFCDAWSYFVDALAVMANALQTMYYLFDWPALWNNIKQTVEAKATSDWNTAIGDIQNTVDAVYDDINANIAKAYGDVQNAVNSVYGLVNDAIGLASGLAIPVAQVQNITPTGFEVYTPGGGVTTYWLAVL